MPRKYYPPRKKEPKIPAFQIQEERINRVLEFLKIKGEISDFDLQKIMEWGPGIHERIMRIIKNNYQDVIRWDKKTRTLTHISKPIEVTE